MPAANKKNLLEFLRVTEVDAAAIAAAIKAAREDRAEPEVAVDDALEVANKILKGHGIEAIRSGQYLVDHYFRDIVALYVNMGDTYETTLLYETDKDRFLVTSWGDWVERNERKYGIT